MRSVWQRHLFLAFVIAVPLAGCGGPRILSEYGALHGALGPQVPFRRSGPHAGVDFGGAFGDAIIAAAAGEVSRLISAPQSCGTGGDLAQGVRALHSLLPSRGRAGSSV